MMVPSELPLAKFRKYYHSVLTTEEKKILIDMGMDPWSIEGLKYADVIDLFDNKQAGAWSQRVYNYDATYKHGSHHSHSNDDNNGCQNSNQICIPFYIQANCFRKFFVKCNCKQFSVIDDE